MLVDQRAEHVLRLLAVPFAAEAAAAPGYLFPNEQAKLVAQFEDAARLLVVAETDEVHAHRLHQAHFLLHQFLRHRRAKAGVVLMPMRAAQEQALAVQLEGSVLDELERAQPEARPRAAFACSDFDAVERG